MKTNDLYSDVALLKNWQVVMYETGTCDHIYECPEEKVYYLTSREFTKKELEERGWKHPHG